MQDNIEITENTCLFRSKKNNKYKNSIVELCTPESKNRSTSQKISQSSLKELYLSNSSRNPSFSTPLTQDSEAIEGNINGFGNSPVECTYLSIDTFDITNSFS